MKGIIFDMDGTMIDNMMVHHRAWQQEMAALGVEMTMEEIKEKVHGINEEILVRLFGDRFTAEQRQTFSTRKEAAYRDLFRADLKLIAGLLPLLEELRTAGIRLAIGTAAPPENVDFVLNELGLHQYFDVVLHADDVEQGKPDPEIYHKAISGLGLLPADCIVFEDSVTGAEASARAGVATVIVTTTHQPHEFEHFDHILQFIQDFQDLELATLREWHAG